MEFREFENKIKEGLEAREIRPSADLWDRLEEKMDAENNSKRKFTILKMAAVLVVLMGVSGILFISKGVKTEITQTDIVVDENKESETKIEIEKVVPAIVEDNKVEVVTESVNKEENISPPKRNIEWVASPKENVQPQQDKTAQPMTEKPNSNLQEVYLVNSLQQEESGENLIDFDKIEEEIKPTSTQDLASQLLEEVETSLNRTPEQEAEQLLTAILNKKANSYIERKINIHEVDPDFLLAEVLREMDGDGDRDFRKKVEELFKDGWEKTKNFLVVGLTN